MAQVEAQLALLTVGRYQQPTRCETNSVLKLTYCDVPPWKRAVQIQNCDSIGSVTYLRSKGGVSGIGTEKGVQISCPAIG